MSSLLADVLDASPLEMSADLDAATAGGLLVEGEQAGEFRFVHAIVQPRSKPLSATRRGLLHAAIARRLEESGDDLEDLEVGGAPLVRGRPARRPAPRRRGRGRGRHADDRTARPRAGGGDHRSCLEVFAGAGDRRT